MKNKKSHLINKETSISIISDETKDNVRRITSCFASKFDNLPHSLTIKRIIVFGILFAGLACGVANESSHVEPRSEKVDKLFQYYYNQNL